MNRTFSWIRRPVGPIALDLGTRFIRMLQVARVGGQTTVTACAQHEIPPGTYGSSEREDLLVRSVGSMLAGGRFLGRSVVTALSWDQLQLRNVRMPSMPEEEIADAIRFEAADRMGLGEDKGEVRFLVAGDVRQGTEVRQEVIVLAAEHELIDQHLRLLDRMGLEPAAIEAAPCALFRGFERFLRRGEDQKDANIFVDLGYSGSRVVMSRGADIVFAKTIPIGGRRFDELVGEALSLSPHETVQLRQRLLRQRTPDVPADAASPGESSPDESVRRAVLDAMRPAIEQLSKEIALCIRYCSVTFRGSRADVVTAVGGEAADASLLRMLGDQVRLPFHTGKPFRSIAVETELPCIDRRNGQPEWAGVLGLALHPAGHTLGRQRHADATAGAGP